MDKLNKLKEIFVLNENDEETRQDNLKTITEFEVAIARNKALSEWRQSDISQEFIKTFKTFAHKVTVLLGTNSEIDEKTRQQLFAKRQAVLWFLSIINENPESDLMRIESEISKALETVES